MIEGRINLYSDTQTRPTAAMKEAMVNAPLGDEQSGQDPTTRLLCEKTAALLGKEAAVYLPSGTMCNEIAILVHCRPGDEIYAEKSAHIINFEAGGPSALAGAHIHTIEGTFGMFTAEQLDAAIRVPNRYSPTPRLVEVEQTTNMGGGAVWPLTTIQGVAEVARERGLGLHMDGARLMNAVVASNIEAADFAGPFDSVWIDLSKGLGCPIGAVLAGSQEFIDEAWKWKQRIGGAFRQSGIIAAAGVYALDHHVERLAEDHANARRLADWVTQVDGVKVVPEKTETNIVWIDVGGSGVKAMDISLALEERGINIGAFSPTLLRACTHLDVSAAQVDEAGETFKAVVEALTE